jgi:hypothetical protein
MYRSAWARCASISASGLTPLSVDTDSLSLTNGPENRYSASCLSREGFNALFNVGEPQAYVDDVNVIAELIAPPVRTERAENTETGQVKVVRNEHLVDGRREGIQQ